MSGYKLVPVEPTAEMVEAFKAMWSLGFCDDRMAQECYAAIMDAAPAVQGEPVGWQFYQDGKWWNGDDLIKDHRKNTEEAGFRVRDVYTAPQLAERQHAPHVAALVEALETCLEMEERPKIIKLARAALAAHRKGGVGK